MTIEHTTSVRPDVVPAPLQCPMCRTPIDAATIAGVCSSCPLYHVKKGCRIDLIACPQCGYHSLPLEHGAGVSDDREAAARAPRIGGYVSPSPGNGDERLDVAACAGALRLSEAPAGTRARLLGFADIEDDHLGRLTAYGLLPGVRVEVVQRFPAIILAVYQAELALETGLAEHIWVLPNESRGGLEESTGRGSVGANAAAGSRTRASG